MTKNQAGGWDKCMGPFTPRQAKDYGVDEWDCDSNCYIRTDKNRSKFFSTQYDYYNSMLLNSIVDLPDTVVILGFQIRIGIRIHGHHDSIPV